MIFCTNTAALIQLKVFWVVMPWVGWKLFSGLCWPRISETV